MPGEHVTIISRTGGGKTHLALELADLRPQVLVIAVKRSDPLVEDLRVRGYHVTDNMQDVVRTRDGVPVHPRVVYWPDAARQPGLRGAERAKLLQKPVSEALVWAEDTRNWTLVIDETMYLSDQMRLAHDLDALWFQGRTQHVSVVALAQRPTKIPRLAISQATYLFIGMAADKDDRDRLRDIPAVIPRELVEEGIQAVDVERHEFLFLDTKTNGLAITAAPPR